MSTISLSVQEKNGTTADFMYSTSASRTVMAKPLANDIIDTVNIKYFDNKGTLLGTTIISPKIKNYAGVKGIVFTNDNAAKGSGYFQNQGAYDKNINISQKGNPSTYKGYLDGGPFGSGVVKWEYNKSTSDIIVVILD